MKISVFFKYYNLGELFKQNNEVYYNSNLKDEEEFKANCFSAIFYPLFKSRNKKIEKFPPFLQDFIQMCKNDFLAKKARIEIADDSFTKLYKLSTLKLDDIGFYIKAH
jgi:hypothetical protein